MSRNVYSTSAVTTRNGVELFLHRWQPAPEVPPSSYDVTPSGELHVYAAEHDNDGPEGSIKMREF